MKKLNRSINNLNSGTQSFKVIKITNRLLDHLATTTNTRASRKCDTVLALPSRSQAKLTVVEFVVIGRQTSHCDKASKDQRTRATTITNDDNRRSKETELKPHK
jgi:hypothetical protein